MPIYEYACSDCQKVFEEVIIRRSDEPDVRCPACASPNIERVMSRPAPSSNGTRSRAGGGCAPAG